MAKKPKVAVIGTGGTICSIGTGPFDILDYGANETMLHADALLAKFPEVNTLAEIIAVPFKAVPSPNIYFQDWKEIVLTCDKLVAEHKDLKGVVILHGTASLEETAYFLSLTLKVKIPVVVVGSQRPANALSTDAGMNLANAIRTAASPAARGMGVLVLLNDEIHAAREVTKTSTFRLQTFRSPDFGVLGHADGDAIAFYRKPLRKKAPDTVFDIRTLGALPRVDISYSYTGSDGTAIKAFAKAGAKGIVSAGFAPGFAGPADFEALKDAKKKGVVVMQCTRAGSGRMFKGKRLRDAGFLITDNLNPQKARLLLALALTVTTDPAVIEDIFLTY
jgi:L-asparaginase